LNERSVDFTAKNAKNAKKVGEHLFAVFAFFAVKKTPGPGVCTSPSRARGSPPQRCPG